MKSKCLLVYKSFSNFWSNFTDFLPLLGRVNYWRKSQNLRSITMRTFVPRSYKICKESPDLEGEENIFLPCTVILYVLHVVIMQYPYESRQALNLYRTAASLPFKMPGQMRQSHIMSHISVGSSWGLQRVTHIHN